MRSIFLLCLTLSAALAVGAEITLREEAVAGEGALVRLGDIAQVTGADAPRVARLPLMPAPAPGTKQSISTAAIRAMLAAQGETAAQHRFQGAYTVRISAPVRSQNTEDTAWRKPLSSDRVGTSTAFRKRGKFSREPNRIEPRPIRRNVGVSSRSVDKMVSDAVQEAIDARLGDQTGGERLLVRSVKLTATARRELSALAGQPILVKIPASTAVTAGTLTADLWPESRLSEESFRVVADLVDQPLRLIAKVPLARGAMIVASAVEIEPVPLEEIGRVGSLGYTKLKAVVGKEAKRAIRVGDVLSEGNTAPPVMVRRGEQVFVVSGGGGITVTLQAVAKEDGRQGELVAVEMLDRREQFMARVVGYGRLAVLSAGPDLASAIRTGDLR